MKKKLFHQILLILILPILATGQNITSTVSVTGPPVAQATSVPGNNIPRKEKQKIVVITGVRFAYPLVQKWIDDYNKVNPDIQIVIESRGSADPAKYDILVEAYDENSKLDQSREYIYIARYAVLPVANNKSAFAKTYTKKGLNKDLINQLFFHDIFADKEKEQEIKAPYTIYTRLQKAGSPIIFTKYFGYEQKDVKGKAIAGADEHLLKAILRDSTGVSYLPLSVIYDHTSKKPVDGLAVLPVDLNGNGRISDDEKFYDDLATVVARLEEKPAKDINNVPVEYIHMSVDKTNGSSEAIEFLRWVIQNGQNDLHDFGYLKPEPDRIEAQKFE
jgi:phosphate transport system substrate-binding protein